MALDNGWISKDEMKDMIKPDTEKEDIRYDKYENIEDRESDY